MDVEYIKQRVIQKRIKRKERFARMARIRHRKEKGIFMARPEVLSNIEKCIDTSISIYQCSPGIILGERDGRIDCEPSMLNKSYIGNHITIIQGDVKQVQLKLCKDASKIRNLSFEDLENWKKRGDPSWTEWAVRFEKFSVTYNSFLLKHKDKFTKEKLDKEATNRYNAYEKLQKEFISTKHCVEIKTRFDLEDDYVSEITYNSICIKNLGYEVNEFVNKILREGIPKVKYTESDGSFFVGKTMENFETLFERTIEFPAEEEIRIVGKNKNMKAGKVSIFVSGYFLKQRAELSYMIVCEESRPITVNKKLLNSFHLPIVKDNTSDILEMKAFLDKYYSPGPINLICGIKEVNFYLIEGEDKGDNLNLTVKINTKMNEYLHDESDYKTEEF